MSDSTYDVHPTSPRWTHIALRVADLDATIAWYTEFTPMALLDRREDDAGYGAWLGMPEPTDNPFILVLAQFFPETDPFGSAPRAVLAPFAHLGMELPRREDVDAIAERGKAADCLGMPPTMMPPPIGYICMLKDPDGNTVEFSWDQGVFTTVQERWGLAPS
ncbi:MAG: VOC family protein [Acidimicrobiales bacterium]